MAGPIGAPAHLPGHRAAGAKEASAAAGLARRSRVLAAAAGLGTVAFAIGLWLIVPRPGDLSPPELVPRAAVLGLLFAAPGVVALVGAVRGQRPLLVAAGVLCLGQSVVSFSGVTFPFLLAALALLAVAAEPGPGSRAVRWSVPRVALGVLLAIPVVALAVTAGGFVVVLALVVIAAFARARAVRPEQRAPVSRPGAVAGVLVIALVALAWTAALSTTETTCWTARETPAGLVYERTPSDPGGAITLPPGSVASGCDGGQLTVTGAALAFVLVTGAVVLSIVLPPPRRVTD